LRSVSWCRRCRRMFCSSSGSLLQSPRSCCSPPSRSKSASCGIESRIAEWRGRKTGAGSPAKPSAARRSWPRWSSMLFDHLVRPQQERLRNRAPRRLGDLEVDDQLDLRRCLTGKSGLAPLGSPDRLFRLAQAIEKVSDGLVGSIARTFEDDQRLSGHRHRRDGSWLGAGRLAMERDTTSCRSAVVLFRYYTSDEGI